MSRRCPKCNLGGMTDSEFKRHDCRPVTITAHCQDCLALARILHTFVECVYVGTPDNYEAKLIYRTLGKIDAFIKERE